MPHTADPLEHNFDSARHIGQGGGRGEVTHPIGDRAGHTQWRGHTGFDSIADMAAIGRVAVAVYGPS
jgi:hypothetical protein